MPWPMKAFLRERILTYPGLSSLTPKLAIGGPFGSLVSSHPKLRSAQDVSGPYSPKLGVSDRLTVGCRKWAATERDLVMIYLMT